MKNSEGALTSPVLCEGDCFYETNSAGSEVACIDNGNDDDTDADSHADAIKEQEKEYREKQLASLSSSQSQLLRPPPQSVIINQQIPASIVNNDNGNKISSISTILKTYDTHKTGLINDNVKNHGAQKEVIEANKTPMALDKDLEGRSEREKDNYCNSTKSGDIVHDNGKRHYDCNRSSSSHDHTNDDESEAESDFLDVTSRMCVGSALHSSSLSPSSSTSLLLSNRENAIAMVQNYNDTMFKQKNDGTAATSLNNNDRSNLNNRVSTNKSKHHYYDPDDERTIVTKNTSAARAASAASLSSNNLWQSRKRGMDSLSLSTQCRSKRRGHNELLKRWAHKYVHQNNNDHEQKHASATTTIDNSASHYRSRLNQLQKQMVLSPSQNLNASDTNVRPVSNEVIAENSSIAKSCDNDADDSVVNIVRKRKAETRTLNTDNSRSNINDMEEIDASTMHQHRTKMRKISSHAKNALVIINQKFHISEAILSTSICAAGISILTNGSFLLDPAWCLQGVALASVHSVMSDAMHNNRSSARRQIPFRWNRNSSCENNGGNGSNNVDTSNTTSQGRAAASTSPMQQNYCPSDHINSETFTTSSLKKISKKVVHRTKRFIKNVNSNYQLGTKLKLARLLLRARALQARDHLEECVEAASTTTTDVIANSIRGGRVSTTNSWSGTTTNQRGKTSPLLNRSQWHQQIPIIATAASASSFIVKSVLEQGKSSISNALESLYSYQAAS